MEHRSRKSLDELLARVPRDVPLPGNLWAGIERQIAPKPRRFTAFAIAASLGVACIAGALTWAVLHGVPAGDAGATAGATAGAANFDEPTDPPYVAARTGLEQSFRNRIALLDPATRSKIEANLEIIQKAHEELRTALAAQPDNPLLEQLLQDTWHEEFDLYDSVVRGTQPTQMRSPS